MISTSFLAGSIFWYELRVFRRQSGKTKALTHRYAFIVKALGVPSSNVLCVTFTNKAANEMKKRVRALIGDGYDTSLVTTYHGFCVRVLRESISKLFYPENFIILDKADWFAIS